MIFKCVDLKDLKEIGTCVLPDGVIDKPGTEHMFGEQVYVLVKTFASVIPDGNWRMNFRKKGSDSIQ